MILKALSKYEAFVKDIKGLEPGKEEILLVEGIPIRVQLVDDQYIEDLRRRRPRCPD